MYKVHVASTATDTNVSQQRQQLEKLTVKERLIRSCSAASVASFSLPT